MTNNIIPRFTLHTPSQGFNPLGLMDWEVSEGWYLLNEGDPIQSGDGFWDEYHEYWIAFECRADIFRGDREYVHTVPWRRRICIPDSFNSGMADAEAGKVVDLDRALTEAPPEV